MFSHTVWGIISPSLRDKCSHLRPDFGFWRGFPGGGKQESKKARKRARARVAYDTLKYILYARALNPPYGGGLGAPTDAP